MAARPQGRESRRTSIGERERVARKLRVAYTREQLSFQTFVERIDQLFHARTRADLKVLAGDLSPTGAVRRAFTDVATALAESLKRAGMLRGSARTRPLILPTSERIVIGRARDCDCVLGDPSVSRRHALLTFASDEWHLRDLGSLNGTYVNGCRISDETIVQPGDDIAFACEWFRLVLPVDVPRASSLTPSVP